MQIVAVDYRVVRWPIAPRGAARGQWAERTSLLIAVRAESGATGLGEAAPLPGMSIDDIDDALRAAEALAAHVPFTLEVPNHATALADRITPAPAARFAIETALLAALAQHTRTSIATLLKPVARRRRTNPGLPVPSPSPSPSTATPAATRRRTSPGVAVAPVSTARRTSPGTPSASPAAPTTRPPPATPATTATTATTASPVPPALPATPADRLRPATSLTSMPLAELQNAVIVDDEEEALAAVAAGASYLKIKAATPADLERVRRIARAVATTPAPRQGTVTGADAGPSPAPAEPSAPSVQLRIDANRGWPRDQVRTLLASIAHLPIDFVEEPCVDAHTLLAEPLLVRIALDESLVDLATEDLARALSSPHLAALVLKPTLLGGFAHCLELAADAHAHGVAPIVTHTLEGPIGTAACRELARAIGADVAVGLAPHVAELGFAAATQMQLSCISSDTTAPKAHVRTTGARSSDMSSASTASGAHVGTHDSRSSASRPSDAHVGAAESRSLGTSSESSRSDTHVGAHNSRSSNTSSASRPPDAHVGRDRSSGTSSASRPPGAHVGTPASHGGDHRPSARHDSRRPLVLVANHTHETVAAIQTAFREQQLIALLHAKASADEQQRQRALLEAATFGPDDAVVLFTSGSTGPSRGVVLSRAALVANADASAARLGWRDDDRWLACLPLAHAGGLSVVIRCLLADRPIVLGDVGAIGEATIASLVPAQLAQLLEDAAWRPSARLRAVLLGGAAAPPSLVEAAIARGVPVLQTYGLTETFGQVATARVVGGRPVPLAGVEISAGMRGAPAPIRIRGPMLATRYLDGVPIAPELVTADVGFFDGDELVVVGRADDVIISGGENVHPTQVEAVLAATPGVRAAAAYGVGDARWGQVVAAAITVDATFERDRAVARWHAQLPAYARPRWLAIVGELPRLPSGKIDRRSVASVATTPVDYGR